jgi:hypothetical protein
MKSQEWLTNSQNGSVTLAQGEISKVVDKNLKMAKSL